jgi:hypothetical protein
MVALLLLHADEGFWAGDHTGEGKLKDLVTGKQHPIEFKGKEAIWVDNLIRLFVTGNGDWQVPAGFEERRFAVLDVGEFEMGNAEYFAAIDAEMDAGGREALLEFFLTFDLSSVNLRAIPKTGALLEQKIASMSPEQAWWFDTLRNGELPWGCEDLRECPRQRLYDRYLRHAGRIGARRKSIETKLGMFLNKYATGVRMGRGSYKVFSRTRNELVTEYGRTYQFPELVDCRKKFSEMIQHDIVWGDPDMWQHERTPEAMDEEGENGV